MNKEEPKKIIHHKKIYPYHEWALNENGQLDNWAFEVGFHNGYACIRCNYTFCEHCEPNGFETAKKIPCVVEYDTCPNCNEKIYLFSEKDKYCRYCGQRVEK